ncbi:MAG: EAL domain-containing protein [Erysipelotrichaceae bacterium]|nr:EAL domain-containing protein [Erysipelotrichaceae bacterium]
MINKQKSAQHIKLPDNRTLMAFFCTIVVLLCAFAPSAILCEENNNDTLTVGVPIDRCPVFYLDESTNEVAGIGVDLMKEAAKEAGYSVTFKIIEEATLKEALDNKEYDLIMPFGSAISSAEGKESIVSENLIQTPFTLVTKNNVELPPLNNLRVGMLKSLAGAAESVTQLFPGIEITMYDTMSDSVKALRSDKVDALLHNSYVWSYVLQKPSYSDLKVQPSSMFSMDFRAGTLDSEKGRAIIERLNGGIEKIPDTKRQAIVLDYTTRKLYKYDLSDYLYQYGVAIVLGTLLLISIVTAVLLRLRNIKMEQEEKIRLLIDHDSLTGTYNYHGFKKRVEELLRNNPDVPYLLSYNNIKDFKYINDNMGRSAGDELLKYWVNTSVNSMSDEEAMGRIDSDRFVVLRRYDKQEQISKDDVDVLEPVRNYFINKGKGNRIQICTGIYVLTPRDYRQIDVDRMLDGARVAEEKVRLNRKEGYEFYNPEQWRKGKRDAEIISHLTTAIETGEIQVWYQPQVNIRKNEIIGAEALCRWNHSKLGWLQPSEFIPVLEETDAIYQLDQYVWETVCSDLKRWNEEGHNWTVSVNLSRRDIKDDRNIPGHFFDLINKYNINSNQLRIEITESAYVENPELLISTTSKLRKYGFQVEMDDFGSGYSSLHMLKEVPVDRIKLDLHFLSGGGDPERSRIIVSHMIQMMKSLDMNMIVEGVENKSQAEFLKTKGCEEMQGFYFYKPMSVEEFEKIGDKIKSVPVKKRTRKKQ